jgi:hypothetical protein
MAFFLGLDESDDVIQHVDVSVNAHDFFLIFLELFNENDDDALHGQF